VVHGVVFFSLLAFFVDVWCIIFHFSIIKQTRTC
jgi:hypothetical protein